MSLIDPTLPFNEFRPREKCPDENCTCILGLEDHTGDCKRGALPTDPQTPDAILAILRDLLEDARDIGNTPTFRAQCEKDLLDLWASRNVTALDEFGWPASIPHRVPQRVVH